MVATSFLSFKIWGLVVYLYDTLHIRLSVSGLIVFSLALRIQNL